MFQGVHENMPNVQLSQALAECRAGNKSQGQQLLFTAIGKYPWMVSRLMHELQVDAPPAVWGKEASSMKEKLHAELYATRAKDLWSTPENTSLLVETASAVPVETPTTAAPDASDITQNVARHVLLSDVPALIALIPRHFSANLDSASDPLPPDDGFESYIQRPTRPHVPTRISDLEDPEFMRYVEELINGALPAEEHERAVQMLRARGLVLREVDDDGPERAQVEDGSDEDDA
jgi:hypothetical protein